MLSKKQKLRIFIFGAGLFLLSPFFLDTSFIAQAADPCETAVGGICTKNDLNSNPNYTAFDSVKCPNDGERCWTANLTLSECSDRGGDLGCIDGSLCSNNKGIPNGACTSPAGTICCKSNTIKEEECNAQTGVCQNGCAEGTPSGHCSNGMICCVPKGTPPPPGGCAAGSTCSTGATCPAETTQTGTCGEKNDKACCKPDSGTPPPPGGGGGYGKGGPVNVLFDNPLEYDTVQGVVGSLIDYLQGIIVLLSVVFIVIGAVLYVTSGGSETQIKMAKKAIFAAMIGLAIGIAAPTFLKEIAIILDWGQSENLPDDVSNAISLAEILSNVLSFLLGVVGVLALIMLVIGGIMYLFSGGDEGRAKTGKSIVTYAVIGILVALAALVIVRQIALFFAA